MVKQKKVPKRKTPLNNKHAYLCYCLRNANQRAPKTYVGITNHWTRRCRQHNGELKGGARYTRGGRWTAFFHVSGFPSKREALQFEWAMKHKRRPGSRLRGRCKTLWYLLNLERVTQRATCTREWRLCVHMSCKKSEFLRLACLQEDEFQSRMNELTHISFLFGVTL